MGKKGRKSNRGPPRGRAVVHSPKTVSQEKNANIERVDDGVKVIKEKKLCPHLENGVDLDKLAAKLQSSAPIRCEDCRERVNDRRVGKGKGKSGKKKGSASLDSKSESKVWVCLECGHYACAGVGLPTADQYHAVRHIRQTRHRLMIRWDNPQLRWCFPCSTLLPIEKTEENGETKDVLAEVVKLLKQQSSEASASQVDVEDARFGSGTVLSETKSEVLVPGSLDGTGSYVVCGLVNLGNTCFFNSVMQNLLALDRLRDYYLNLDTSAGPLSISLKKLLAETKVEAGLKNVINPKVFYGCISSKAPQFKGYQQHDSHELLRFLLDGLCAEELGFRKQINASKDIASSNQDPTLVEALFGGQISSTLRCVECGHSSTVYEPFLDLSLPVPTKKAPSKKVQSVPRAKKSNLPPKKTGRNRPKVNKDAHPVSGQSSSKPSPSSESHSSGPVHAAVPPGEKIMASSVDSALSGTVGTMSEAKESTSASENLLAFSESETAQVTKNSTQQVEALVDDSTWLDYLERGISDDSDLNSQYNDALSLQDSVKEDTAVNEALLESDPAYKPDGDPNVKPNNSCANLGEEEHPLQVKDAEILLLPYYEESSSTKEVVKEGEASSLIVSSGQEELDFDGFGDMFNEPEFAAGPLIGPSLANEIEEAGFMAGNGSDSDPGEVDNTDSPVSVESCLALFIKPELLSDDNAWHCENCSKTLLQERLEAKNKQAQMLQNLISGGKAQSYSKSPNLDKDRFSPSTVKSFSNGDISTEISLNTYGESSLSHAERIDFLNPNGKTVGNGEPDKLNSGVSLFDEGKGEIEDASGEKATSVAHSESRGQESSSESQIIESCTTGSHCGSHKFQQSDSEIAENCQSGQSEDEEINSKSMKVKRNATKSVLVNKAPPILTIHLKRFSQDSRGRLSKLNGHVSFREIIDLRPYMDIRCTDTEKCLYRLVGVVEHTGTMRRGHYVAFVRGGDRRGKAKTEDWSSVWYHVSDAHVRQVSLEVVLRSEAYILFYERI
ncbi:hypothetical protein SLE2022_256010 [Rubroshorea leprosula]